MDELTTTTARVEDIEWPYLSPSPSLFTGSKTNNSHSSSATGWVPVIGPAQVLVVPRFLSPKDSQTLIDYIEEVMAEPSRVDPKPTRRPGYAYRDNDRFSFHSQEFADMIWHKVGLDKMWGRLWRGPMGLETTHNLAVTSPGKTKNSPIRTRYAVGLSPNIRFYRYQSGQSFGAHYDDSVEDKDGRTKSEYTVLVYLNGDQNSDLIGGETVFYPSGQKKRLPNGGSSKAGKGGAAASTKRNRASSNKTMDATSSTGTSSASGLSGSQESFWFTAEDTGGIAVKPQQGLLLVHKHGDDCMLHEALGVQRGNKYVLRTDVVYEL